MPRPIFLHSLAVALACFSAAALGADEAQPTKVAPIDAETRVVLRSISERYKGLQKWEADFAQETFSVGLGNKTFNEGHFVFEAPNRFRYSLIRPEASDFISNGEKAWYVSFREGREKPAHVRAFESLKQIELDRYLVLLRGINTLTKAKEKALLKDFAVSGKSTPSELTLDLSPKNSAEVSNIRLVFKNDRPVVHQATITDSLGNTTTITVKDYKVLKKVDPSEFTPKYPESSKVEKL